MCTTSEGVPEHAISLPAHGPVVLTCLLFSVLLRSHSAPHRREVNVQLLDPGQLHNPKSPQDDSSLRISSRNVPGQGTSSQNALGVARVQMEAGMSSGHLGDGTSAAAAAAAAVAPLIKVNLSFSAPTHEDK